MGNCRVFVVKIWYKSGYICVGGVGCGELWVEIYDVTYVIEKWTKNMVNLLNEYYNNLEIMNLLFINADAKCIQQIGLVCLGDRLFSMFGGDQSQGKE